MFFFPQLCIARPSQRAHTNMAEEPENAGGSEEASAPTESESSGESHEQSGESQQPEKNTHIGGAGMSVNDSEKRQIEIVKTLFQYKAGQIFEWGQKEKTLKDVLAPLNESETFGGNLKLGTLKDRWRKAEKHAEDIITQGEEKFVKLNQNGGRELSELNQLYLELAARMKNHRDKKQREKEEAAANTEDAQHRMAAAMTTVARRCGYDDVEHAERVLAGDKEEQPPSQTPEKRKELDKSPEVEDASEGGEGGSSGKKKKGKPQSKRASVEPGLRPDRDRSADPMMKSMEWQDRLMDYLERSAKSDEALLEGVTKAQVATAQAERMHAAVASADALIRAQAAGVALPPALLKLMEGGE